MEYTTLFEPLLIVTLCVTTGIMIGAIGVVVATAQEIKDINKELDKFRGLYFKEIEKWRNKYVNDDYEAY